MIRPNQRSHSTDKYLEAIFRIEKKNGAVRVKNVALELGLLKGSVSGALKKLEALGYIDYPPYQPITLTARGRRIAESIVQRNRVLARFLTEVLQMSPETSRTAVRRMGPATPEMVIECMRRFLSGLPRGPAASQPGAGYPAENTANAHIEGG